MSQSRERVLCCYKESSAYVKVTHDRDVLQKKLSLSPLWISQHTLVPLQAAYRAKTPRIFVHPGLDHGEPAARTYDSLLVLLSSDLGPDKRDELIGTGLKALKIPPTVLVVPTNPRMTFFSLWNHSNHMYPTQTVSRRMAIARRNGCCL